MSKRFCALDWGEKRIGIAISDPFNIYALPCNTFINNSTFNDKLCDFVIENKITDCVIGMPLMADGKDTFISLKVKEFSNKLKNYFFMKQLAIQIHFIDERFTTNRVYEESRCNDLQNAKKLKHFKDAIAAAYILHDFLSLPQS